MPQALKHWAKPRFPLRSSPYRPDRILVSVPCVAESLRKPWDPPHAWDGSWDRAERPKTRGNRGFLDPEADIPRSLDETFFQKGVVSRKAVDLTDPVLTNAATQTVAEFINRAG